MNTANGAGANGHHHNLNLNAAINSNQFTKSLDDWLNSNCNNMNNNNGSSGGMMAMGGGGGNAGVAVGATTVTNNNTTNSHLDDWLNATMKDSPKTFSVSSTEFLDGPQRNMINSNGLNTTSIVMPPINLLRMMPEYQVSHTNKI